MAKPNDYVDFKRRIANSSETVEVVHLLQKFESLDNPMQRLNIINKQIADLKTEKKQLQASMKSQDTEVSMRDIAGSRIIDLLAGGAE